MDLKQMTEWIKFLLIWLTFARVWGFDLIMQLLTVGIVIIMIYDFLRGSE